MLLASHAAHPLRLPSLVADHRPSPARRRRRRPARRAATGAHAPSLPRRSAVAASPRVRDVLTEPNGQPRRREPRRGSRQRRLIVPVPVVITQVKDGYLHRVLRRPFLVCGHVSQLERGAPERGRRREDGIAGEHLVEGLLQAVAEAAPGLGIQHEPRGRFVGGRRRRCAIRGTRGDGIAPARRRCGPNGPARPWRVWVPSDRRAFGDATRAAARDRHGGGTRTDGHRTTWCRAIGDDPGVTEHGRHRGRACEGK